jgi:hypothetical protein
MAADKPDDILAGIQELAGSIPIPHFRRPARPHTDVRRER